MIFTTKCRLYIDFKLNSSETIMFNKGGSHTLPLSGKLFHDEYDQVVISFQMASEDQSRHDFILKSAAQHINSRETEQKEADEGLNENK